MRRKLVELYQYRDFIREFTIHQLRQRYQGSFLGFLWTLLYPLLVFASFTLIFSRLNHWNIADFGIYFLTGYMAWNFFANSVQHAAESVVWNAALVTSVSVPKSVFPIASVLLHTIDLAATFVVLLGLILIVHAPISISMLFLPVSIALTFIFVLGCALLAAAFNVFFRDFRYALSAAMFLGFFFSPILWKLQEMPPESRWAFSLNPLVHFLALYEAPVWARSLPSASDTALCTAISLATLIAGLMYFFRSERRFFFYL